MPKHLRNWTFEDVAEFLEQHHFVLRNIEGSHHYFVGLVDGKERVCHIQRHPNETIHPKTLKINVIEKSGIPLDYWDRWGSAGSTRAKRKVQYEGAVPRTLLDARAEPHSTFIQTEGRQVDGLSS